MEHRDAQALLELAAVEPDGFARLAAGDTPEAAALAGHLAGCPECAAEFEHLGRLAGDLRDAVRALPPADLRERTLAMVATTGRARSPEAATQGRPSGEIGTEAPAARKRAANRSWMLATAASLVIAVAGVAGWWSARSDVESEQAAMSHLAEVTEAAVRVGAQPDAAYVGLAAAPAGVETAKGEIVVSSASHELVAIADGLDEPPDGMEYRCWVEIDGVREEIGKMYLYGGLATWAGWSDPLDRLVSGSVFGISLVEIDGDGTGEPLLSGEL